MRADKDGPDINGIDPAAGPAERGFVGSGLPRLQQRCEVWHSCLVQPAVDDGYPVSRIAKPHAVPGVSSEDQPGTYPIEFDLGVPIPVDKSAVLIQPDWDEAFDCRRIVHSEPVHEELICKEVYSADRVQRPWRLKGSLNGWRQLTVISPAINDIHPDAGAA
jgi:hypothetical protein